MNSRGKNIRPGSLRKLRAALLAWFEREQRDLPWRKTRDPYRIWISEIMLQQTRVGVVLQRYGEFLERFPDVRALANARPDDVLATWSGLGYYRRARSLHQAAQEIAGRRSGRFPVTAAELRSLPGIGRYTAAAIASIAFHEPVAVVDGNVERVLRRLRGLAAGPISQIWTLAEQLLEQDRPGDFNQAMMELGATVCLPTQPRCAECPIRRGCATQGALRRAVKNARKIRNICYGLAQRRRCVYLVRRPSQASLMPGMWELPEICANGSPVLFELRHAITVTDYRVAVSSIKDSAVSGGRWIKADEAVELPLTGLARRILRRAAII